MWCRHSNGACPAGYGTTFACVANVDRIKEAETPVA
jgi:hypothetical protein